MKETVYQPGCDFCAIAKGEASETEVVWEADDWLAFFPLDPATPGHTLVIPRGHVTDLWEVEPPLDGSLMRASIQVGRAIQSALRPDGMNLITSSGRIAEQSVFHLHLHLVPRWADDGFGPIWPVQGGKYENADLEVTAEMIQAAYAQIEEKK
jgi:histidine triad (HIT) family protein